MHSQLFNPEVFPILCGSLVGLTAIVVFGLGATLVKLVRTIVDYRLKAQMLDRGMSPQEIEQVLNAQSSDRESLSRRHGRGMIGKKGVFTAGHS